MNEIVLQVCNKCLEEKDSSLFDIRRLVCKSCENLRRQKSSFKNKDRERQRHIEWRKQNKARAKEIHHEWSKKSRAELGETYVKHTFINRGDKAKDIHPELIEAKREQLRLHRLVVQLQQAIIEVETTEKETP